MIETILKSLKSEVGDKILSNADIPSDKLDGVFSVIGDVASKEVTGKMMGGDLSTVMNLFSKQTNNSSANLLQNNIISGVVSGLVSKLGLSKQVSNTIANIAVPALINLITKKNSETPDDDPSPLNEIFGSIMSGNQKSSGNMLGNMAKKFMGGLFKKK
ncbi:MAG: hypothetical protein EOM06_10185 [Sphingobacteriia bacterium]|nr:hypothetical protein [Sphingobacteriia bacterium]